MGVAALVTSVALAPLATPGAAATRATPNVARPCGVAGAGHDYTHVVWIIEENVGYAVVGSPAAPYFNALASRCALATNYHAAGHPSLPNYVALTSGSTQGITDDGEPSSHPLAVSSIFSQLRGRWRAYAQSMPRPCDRTTSGVYAARHNPAVYYVNLGAACPRDDVNLPAHPTFYAPFTLVVPNVCDDMHSCPIATGDAWLRSFVPEVLASPPYRAGNLVLVITFDESDASATNLVPTVVVAPSVPAGLRVNVPLSHYALLRTTEQLLGLAPLGAAAHARSMLAPFHL